MKRIRLARRTMLRGMGLTGLSIALPPLEAMMDSKGWWYMRADAQAVAPPKRLVIMHWPQGMPGGWGANDFGHFFPNKAGALPDPLPRALRALAPHRNDISLVSGLGYEAIHGSVGSHGHASALFSGYKATPSPENNSKPVLYGPSVDQVAAGSQFAAGTRHQSLVTGLYGNDNGDVMFSAYASPDGKFKESPQVFEPADLFSQFFRGLDLNPDTAAAAVGRKRSILDYVKGDIEGLQRVLGTNDKARLDEHLTSIRDIEKALTAPISASCALPQEPTIRFAQSGDNNAETYAQLMMQLSVMAIRCDLTRVAFISLGPSQNYRTFPFLNGTYNYGELSLPRDWPSNKELSLDFSKYRYHTIAHSGQDSVENADLYNAGKAGEMRRFYLYAAITEWHMKQVAYMLTLLKASEPGEPSLLDSTAFVATSEFSDAGLHYDRFVPAIIAGKAGGTAIQLGKNITVACPKEDQANAYKVAPWCPPPQGSDPQDGRCINDLWTTALQAVGALGAGTKFGDPALDTKTIPGLWI